MQSSANNGKSTGCMRKKTTLVSMCKERNIEPSGMKYENVQRLALALNEDGTKALPKSPKEIGRLNLS